MVKEVNNTFRVEVKNLRSKEGFVKVITENVPKRLLKAVENSSEEELYVDWNIYDASIWRDNSSLHHYYEMYHMEKRYNNSDTPPKRFVGRYSIRYSYTSNDGMKFGEIRGETISKVKKELADIIIGELNG